MRVRREACWVLWGLWVGCLVFSVCFIIWFLVEAISLYLEAESW
ncbi:hypothetical protein [Streptomyces sp. NPDC059466]